jgi:hypothetical protein
VFPSQQKFCGLPAAARGALAAFGVALPALGRVAVVDLHAGHVHQAQDNGADGGVVLRGHGVHVTGAKVASAGDEADGSQGAAGWSWTQARPRPQWPGPRLGLLASGGRRELGESAAATDDAPTAVSGFARPIPTTPAQERIKRWAVLGGLINEYERAA